MTDLTTTVRAAVAQVTSGCIHTSRSGYITSLFLTISIRSVGMCLLVRYKEGYPFQSVVPCADLTVNIPLVALHAQYRDGTLKDSKKNRGLTCGCTTVSRYSPSLFLAKVSCSKGRRVVEQNLQGRHDA